MERDGGIDIERLGLPVANPENKKLEAEVHAKEKEIAALQLQIEEHRERAQAISDHLKNVRQELQHTQGLYAARKKDGETEDHLKQIAEREEGRLAIEMKRMDTERNELKEKMNIYENTVFKTNKMTDELKKKMNWEQQALEAWLEESARQDEDSMTIAKYARADESKIKELTLRLEHLQDNVFQRRKLLDNEVTETLSAQIGLDKTAESFRKAHHERQELIRQWELTIEQMKRRDADMERCTTELARLKGEIKAREDAIHEKQEFLDNEKENNVEKDKALNISERGAAKLRLQYQDEETARVQFKDELETLKYSVDRTAADLDSTRAQSSHLSRDIKDKRRKLDTLQKQRELMQFELKKWTKRTLSAEERAQRMDQILAEEEDNVSAMEKELEALRKKQFKRAQELFEFKSKETGLEAEIQGGRAAIRNLSSKHHKLDEEALKQQEILYTQDFQLQQLQHKLNRMEGERTEEEKAALTARITALEVEWERQQAEEHVLRGQLKRLQDDLRRINRQLERGQGEKATLEEKIDEINLHIDSTQRELKKVVAAKQDLMVDENIVKLEVKRLRDLLFCHADEVQSLEKRKLQLDTAMSERSKEISLHKDMLRAQVKACESERQTVSSELHERISKIDKLKKRYEIITVSMQPPEDEEEHSQAYYVIKAAQQREELQRKGDDLDTRIQKAEKEIRALENTLKVMNSKNENYRKSLTRVDTSGEEVGELEALEGQWRAGLEKFKHKRRIAQQMEADLQAMGRTLSLLQGDEAAVVAELEDKQNTLATLNRELEEMKNKKQRVHKQTAKIVKDIRAKQKALGPSDIERDIELRELRDYGSGVVQQLGGLAAKQPELASTLQLLFSQAGLPPPPSPSSSRAGSVPSSARSSISQSSSISLRSSSSRLSATPTAPLQTRSIEIGDALVSGSSTPKAGVSPRSSISSLGSSHRAPSKTSLASSRQSSRAGSHTSSRLGSRPSSKASSSGGSGSSSSARGQRRRKLDLSIGPQQPQH